MKFNFDFDNGFNTGLEMLCIRQLVNQAEGAATNAAGTAAGLGSQAASEGANLNPFYNREMNAEHAYDPTQINEMLTAADAGAGAATGAEEAGLARQAAVTGNAAGQTKNLDELARDKSKAAAGASEGIAGQDVNATLGLRQAGAEGESGLYGENLKGQLAAMGQQSSDLNAATQASQTGWLQQGEGILNTGANIAKAYQGQ